MPELDPVVEDAEVEVLGEESPAEETKVETHDGFIALDKHQKDVNVQHKRFRDEERARVKEQTRADALQAMVDDMSRQDAVVVPPVPDKYSDTYEAEIAARDAAIRKQADQEAANTAAVNRKDETDKARLADEDAALNKRVATFDSNSVSHGLNQAEVGEAAAGVIAMGISNTFQDILLDDKDGPLFVKYLNANPVEAEQINAMSTMELVNHLNAEVRPKALLLKPQTSTAPNPPITLEGGGAPETKESWEQGAKYE